MNKALVVGVIILLLCTVYLCGCGEREKPIIVSMKDLVLNKSMYEDKYIECRGRLRGCLKEDYNMFFIVIFIPISTGNGGIMLMPMFFPIFDKYYVYEVEDCGYRIAVSSKVDKDNLIGDKVKVIGYVDGLYSHSRDKLDWIIKSDIIEDID